MFHYCKHKAIKKVNFSIKGHANIISCKITSINIYSFWHNLERRYFCKICRCFNKSPSRISLRFVQFCGEEEKNFLSFLFLPYHAFLDNPQWIPLEKCHHRHLHLMSEKFLMHDRSLKEQMIRTLFFLFPVLQPER